MDLSLRSIANALSGDVVGGQVLAPGPVHSRKDRSLAIRLSSQALNGLVVNSFAGDDWRECRKYVLSRLGIDTRRIVEPSPAERMNARAIRRREEAAHDAQQAERTEFAVRLFNEAQEPYGSPVETYLQSRRVWQTFLHGASDWLRFHPACPFAGQRTPAMICLARDMVTDAPKAIHRTALNQDGSAAEICGHKRLSFGPIGGAAIKITPHGEVRNELGIGEGLESTLSLPCVQTFGSRPIWSLLSAGNFRNFPLFRGVNKLWVAVDHDRAGIDASNELASRWRASGKTAVLLTPKIPKLDLNDIVMEGCLVS